jgi:hypothetical protein
VYLEAATADLQEEPIKLARRCPKQKGRQPPPRVEVISGAEIMGQSNRIRLNVPLCEAKLGDADWPVQPPPRGCTWAQPYLTRSRHM